MVSIKDVAREAQVSVSTVSHVINETRHVAPETKKNVEQAVEKLGYQPSSLARALKNKRTRTLGMLVTNSTNPFFAEVVRGMEEGCFQNNFSLILCNSNYQSDRQLAYLDILRQKRIDGLVVMSTNNDPAFLNALAKLPKLPKVILDSQPGLDACAIHDDSLHGGRLATEHLIQQGLRKIGCLTGPEGHPRSRERYQGFANAMRDAGLEINPDWIIPGRFTPEGGYAGARELLNGKSRPEAIFAFNDLIAMGAYRAFTEFGLSVPEDISIIGYDDLEFAGYLSPPLTTIHQPSYDLGLNAAVTLISHIEKQHALPPVIQLEPELVVRESVKP